MMTWVTPTAMMPMTATCRIITVRRWGLNRKLCPTTSQPTTSKNNAMPMSTMKMLASGGSLRRRGASPGVAALVACSVAIVPLPVSSLGRR
jgi:hypothetical protein